jgi:hypothetical protein
MWSIEPCCALCSWRLTAARVDDKDVTRFCRGVTSGDSEHTSATLESDIHEDGRGESAGIEGMVSSWTIFRCRRCAGFVLAVVAACAGDEPAEEPPAATPTAAPDPESAAPTAESASASGFYYRSYLDEVLGGDFGAARDGYRAVVEDGSAEPEVAARAALRLAEYEADAGRRHIALDLVARAAAMGRDHRDLLQWAERLQRRLAAVRAHDLEVRGPPAGTPLEGVSAQAAELHARAEDLLSAYHARRLQPRLEDLGAGVRAKRAAMEAAVRAYRQVAALGEPAATVAAELRTGGLYYDLSLSLTFDLPSELEPGAADELRQSLRAQALADRNRARGAYLRALEAGRDGRAGPAGRIWLEAAELGLRSTEDLLRGRD